MPHRNRVTRTARSSSRRCAAHGWGIAGACTEGTTSCVRGPASGGYLCLEFRGWVAPKWAGPVDGAVLHDEASRWPPGIDRVRVPPRGLLAVLRGARRERRGRDRRRLHADRLDGRRKRLHTVPWVDVPDGASSISTVLPPGRRRKLAPWVRAGRYGVPRPRPTRGDAS